MKVINLTKIAAAMVLLGSVGVHAAVDPATLTSSSKDLVFAAEAGAVALVISPETNLNAGALAESAQVATFVATPTDLTARIAYRWTPSSGDVDPVHPRLATFSGTTSTNKIVLSLAPLDNIPAPKDDGWFAVDNPGVLNGQITSGQAQTVAADTYNISMDAAIWTA